MGTLDSYGGPGLVSLARPTASVTRPMSRARPEPDRDPSSAPDRDPSSALAAALLQARDFDEQPVPQGLPEGRWDPAQGAQLGPTSSTSPSSVS